MGPITEKTSKNRTSVLKTLGKVAKGLWFGVSALIIPISVVWKNKAPTINLLRSLGKVAVNVTFFTILHPAAGKFFPTAEDVLKERGYDTEVVSDLVPGLENKIHVRTDNAVGKVHAFFDNHPLTSIFGETSLKKDNVIGYANKKSGVHLVYLKEDKIFPKPKEDTPPKKDVEKTEDISDVFYLPRDVLYLSAAEYKHIHLTPEEKYLSLLFHEIRHHSEVNKYDTVIENEADSEYYAALAVAKIKNDPTFVERYIDNLSKKMFEETHNVALIVDAMYNDQPIPNADDVDKANKDAQHIIDMMWDQRTMEGLNLCEKWPKQHEEICEADKNADCLSELAQRRIVLFQEGTHGAVKKNVKVARK